MLVERDLINAFGALREHMQLPAITNKTIANNKERKSAIYKRGKKTNELKIQVKAARIAFNVFHIRREMFGGEVRARAHTHPGVWVGGWVECVRTHTPASVRAHNSNTHPTAHTISDVLSFHLYSQMLSINNETVNTPAPNQPQAASTTNEEEEANNPLLNTPPEKAPPIAPPDQKHNFTVAKMKINRQPQF